MQQETKNCQNCKKEFIIYPEDFDFYEKLKVPAPTFCPECRKQRRFLWRNERALYKRESDLSGKDIISLFSKDKPFKIYDQSEWWSDKWEASAYAREYDFSKPFFSQFRSLQEKVPRLPIFNVQCENSAYANQAYSSKNVYLSFSVVPSEDCAYCTNIGWIKNGFDLLFTHKSELIYQSIDTERCNNSSFLFNCEDCINSAFLYDCRNCQNCIGAIGLRNKSYILWGEQLTKEQYEIKKKELNLGSFAKIIEAQKKFEQMILEKPRRAAKIKNCVNSTGDFLVNCKNANSCFGAYDLENCRYSARLYSTKDSLDNYGLGKAELAYETIGNEEIYNCRFCNIVDPSRNLTYCDLCFNCSDCFGCVGLRGKQYRILNKQYSKDEYDELVPKIIQHMNEMPYISRAQNSNVKSQNHNSNVKTEENIKTQEIVYHYGEFFPPELSPFCYNETITQEYFPLTKDQAIEQGYSWKDPEPRNYQIDIKTEQLPDNIKDISDDIIGKVIECQHKGQCNEQCTEAFKIIEPELAFYRRMNLPLPRLCPNCRHYQRLKQRNPLKLWKRKCQCQGNNSVNGVYQNTITHQHGNNPCTNEFETSYSQDKPEIVYCESCYLQEVV